MKIKYISGDMIDMMKDPEQLKIPTIYVHGCNCHLAMKSGIAAGIAIHFPEAEDADRWFFQYFKDNMDMLGQYSYIDLTEDKSSKLCNLYTQFFPGPDLRLEALEGAFVNIAEDYGSMGYRLVMPKIGAGRAGGDWDVISRVIENTICDFDFTEVICVEWNK